MMSWAQCYERKKNPLATVEMVNIELDAKPGFEQQHYTSLTTGSDHKTDIERSPQSRNILYIQSIVFACQRKHCWIIPEVFTISLDSEVILVLPNGWIFFP